MKTTQQFNPNAHWRGIASLVTAKGQSKTLTCLKGGKHLQAFRWAWDRAQVKMNGDHEWSLIWLNKVGFKTLKIRATVRRVEGVVTLTVEPIRVFGKFNPEPLMLELESVDATPAPAVVQKAKPKRSKVGLDADTKKLRKTAKALGCKAD